MALSRLARYTWLAMCAAVTLVFLVRHTLETRSGAREVLTSADELKDVERAYVSVQHRLKSDEWPEDFSFHQCQNEVAGASEGGSCYRLHISIANSGLTPAHIEGGGIQLVPFMDQTPFRPPVVTHDGRGEIASTILDARARYSERLTYYLTSSELEALKDNRLWLVGYVHYVDVFGARHRAGFCRRVGASEDAAHKVLFADATCGPYNQDRPIGESTGQKT